MLRSVGIALGSWEKQIRNAEVVPHIHPSTVGFSLKAAEASNLHLISPLAKAGTERWADDNTPWGVEPEDGPGMMRDGPRKEGRMSGRTIHGKREEGVAGSQTAASPMGAAC